MQPELAADETSNQQHSCDDREIGEGLAFAHGHRVSEKDTENKHFQQAGRVDRASSSVFPVAHYCLRLWDQKSGLWIIGRPRPEHPVLKTEKRSRFVLKINWRRKLFEASERTYV